MWGGLGDWMEWEAGCGLRTGYELCFWGDVQGFKSSSTFMMNANIRFGHNGRSHKKD